MYTLDDIEKLITVTKKLTLLYVEDNPEARETTLMVFEEFFDNIIVATNGEEGLEKFKANDVDFIITDINMPKLNGLDMISEIRRIDEKVLIFVLSAYNESGFFIESIKLGVEGYLLKPIEMDQFIGIFNKVVTKLELMEEAQTYLHFLKEYEDLTNSSAIVTKADINGRITFVNDKFCSVTGYSRDELLGQSHRIIQHPDVDKELYYNIWMTVTQKKKLWSGIVKILSKNGKNLYMDTTIKPLLDSNGNLIEYIALLKDITDIMNPKKQLSDTIKNLQNPLVIYMKLEEYDVLEELYDTDTVEMIQERITKYLQKAIQDVCHFEKVFQLGNGEYAVAQEKEICIGNDKEGFLKRLFSFQEKVRNDKVDIGEIDYDMAIMISVSYESQKVLESAMLGIKKLLKEKGEFIIANDLARQEHQSAQENIKKVSMIKKAIETQKIISYFQPIINNQTKKIEKYESLVRLVNNNNILTPFHFLDIAKKSKYYPHITDIVLEHSFEALKHTDREISINLSAIDIENERTRNTILKLLKDHKDESSRLVFELLEDESVKSFDLIREFIVTIKDFGVQVAIDDFGAGYSNFERLVDFSPDILKIDGSLTKGITTNSYSLSVVKTIVTFAKEQNIKTVAEFVENEEIYNTLLELGVDYSQGYFFGKPQPLEKAGIDG